MPLKITLSLVVLENVVFVNTSRLWLRTFQGEICRKLEEVKTGIRIVLSGLCLLEVMTRAEGCAEPLNAVTGAHVCQVQLQQACANSNVCVLQSFVPE